MAMPKELVIVIEGWSFGARLNGYYESKSLPGVWFADRVEILQFVYSSIVPDQTGRP